MTIDCLFSGKKTFDGSQPEAGEFWNYSEVHCSSSLPDYLTLISSTDNPPRQFYLSQLFTFGDGLIVAILLLLTFITLMFKIGSILKRH